WMLDLDPTLDWPAPPAIIPVVNMSVGTDTPTYPYVTNDIVNLATFGASRHVLVVLSAGNCGRAGNGSMSAWALPTWVLAVGASEDRTGAVLADYSSRGIPSQPGTGPDLVAFGRSAVPPHPRGTSFAAPRVAGLARLVAAAICQLGREVRLAEGGAPEGVPLVGYGMIDTFGSEIWQDERGPVPFLALPVLGVDAGAVHELVTIAKAAGITVDVAGTPQLLRDLVVGSARPMPGYEPHEVGAGFVDRAAVLDHLGRVTGADVVRWFGSGDADPGVAAALAGPKVFVREELDRLADVLGMTGPVWPYDYTRGRVALLPSSETERSQLPPDEQAFGIPLVWPANPFAAGPKA
ncbi:MAG: S8 family serine peptidase, partial [Acidimicrobiales bacterium]